MGRCFAIGDIHGCITALTTVLSRIAPTRDDTLVFLGDYVDRGPDSAGVISTLMELRQRTGTVFVRGNHEEMMLDARSSLDMRRGWMRYGAIETLDSYEEGEFPTCVQQAHWQFLEDTLDFHETADHIFVHAPIRAELPVAEQTSHDHRWSFELPARPHCSGKTVVCGRDPATAPRANNW